MHQFLEIDLLIEETNDPDKGFQEPQTNKTSEEKAMIPLGGSCASQRFGQGGHQAHINTSPNPIIVPWTNINPPPNECEFQPSAQESLCIVEFA